MISQLCVNLKVCRYVMPKFPFHLTSSSIRFSSWCKQMAAQIDFKFQGSESGVWNLRSFSITNIVHSAQFVSCIQQKNLLASHGLCKGYHHLALHPDRQKKKNYAFLWQERTYVFGALPIHLREARFFTIMINPCTSLWTGVACVSCIC